MPIGYDDNNNVIVQGDDGAGEGINISKVTDGSIERLAVDAKFSGTTPGATSPCPTVTNKLRHEFSKVSQGLNTSYTTVYTYSGSGAFMGFVLDFDDDDVVVKFSVDSETIFELEAEDIDDIQQDFGSDFGINGNAGGPLWDDDDDKMIYKPPCAISYSSEVKIEVKTTSGTSDLDKYLVTLTKES